MSYHCNYQYIIYIDNVKVYVKVAEKKRRQFSDVKSNDEPRAILIAQIKEREQQDRDSQE